jgi:hypothetical protein
LVATFAKNVKGNLSKAERNDLAQVKSELDKRYGTPQETKNGQEEKAK